MITAEIILGAYVTAGVITFLAIMLYAHVSDGIDHTAFGFASVFAIFWPIGLGIAMYEGITGKHIFP